MVKNASELMAPVSVDEFISEYWGRKPLHVPGPPEKLTSMFSREAYFDYCASPRSDLFIGKADSTGHFHQLGVSLYQARALHRLGFTIQMEDLHWSCTPVRELLAGVKKEVGLFQALEAAAFVSPPSTGYGVHFDPNPDAWALQIAGTKRWRLSRQAAAIHPLIHQTLQPGRKPAGDPHVDLERPDESDFIEVEVTPGDVLYFPGGCWHTAEANEESCHVLLASQNAPWTDFLFEQLKDQLLHQSDWRQVPPRHSAWRSPMPQVLEQRCAELVEAIEKFDFSPDGALMKAFLERAQIGDTRAPDQLSPWAYRASPVTYGQSEGLIDYETEKSSSAT
jgi:50S ribosomal protein L16 3-hydroxylase